MLKLPLQMSKNVELQRASPRYILNRGFTSGPHWGQAARSPYRFALYRARNGCPLALVTCVIIALVVPWLEKFPGAATAITPCYSALFFYGAYMLMTHLSPGLKRD
jgi:hypothetical protein